MNGAAEAILEELLAQSKTQTQLLQQLARNFTGGGGGGGGGVIGAAASVASSFGALNVVTKVIAGLFNGLSNIVSTVFKLFGAAVGIVTNVVQAFDNLGKIALETGAKLSDFFKALESIPIIGGVAKFFKGLIEGQETLLKYYRDFSKSGVTFSGNLLDLVQAARTTSLTLGELQAVLNTNRDAFAILGGGNVQAGYEKFITTQNRLMAVGSGFREQLLGLGVTSEQAAGFLGTLIRSQGVMSKNREIDESKLAKQTSEYILQLDALTRLTGIQKEELDATIKKAQQDQLFQTFMDTLTPVQRRVADQMIRAAAPFGDEAVQAVKARLRGLDAPVTEFENQIVALGGSSVLAGSGLRDILYSATESTDGFTAGLEFMANVASGVGGAMADIPDELKATGIFSKIPQSLLSLDRSIQQVGLAKALEEVKKQQKDAADGSAKDTAAMQLRIQQLGLVISSVSQTLRGAFAPIIMELAGGMAELAEGLVGVIDELVKSDGFKETVAAVTNWFRTAFTDIREAFKEGGLKGGLTMMFEKLSDGFSAMWEVVKGPIKSAFMSLIDWLKPYWGDLMDSLLGGVADWIYEKTGFGTAPEIRKLEDKMASVMRHAEYAAISKPGEAAAIKSATDQQISQMRSELIEKLLPKRFGKTDVGGKTDYLPEARAQVAKEVDAMISEFRSNYTSRLTETANYQSMPSGPNILENRSTIAGSMAAKPEQLSFDTYNLQLNMLQEFKTFNSNMEVQNRILKGLNGNIYP